MARALHSVPLLFFSEKRARDEGGGHEARNWRKCAMFWLFSTAINPTKADFVIFAA